MCSLCPSLVSKEWPPRSLTLQSDSYPPKLWVCTKVLFLLLLCFVLFCFFKKNSFQMKRNTPQPRLGVATWRLSGLDSSSLARTHHNLKKFVKCVFSCASRLPLLSCLAVVVSPKLFAYIFTNEGSVFKIDCVAKGRPHWSHAPLTKTREL